MKKFLSFLCLLMPLCMMAASQEMTLSQAKKMYRTESVGRVFNFANMVTAINEINDSTNLAAPDNNAVYDINGRKVLDYFNPDDFNNLKPGIYIHKGKKILSCN